MHNYIEYLQIFADILNRVFSDGSKYLLLIFKRMVENFNIHVYKEKIHGVPS